MSTHNIRPVLKSMPHCFDPNMISLFKILLYSLLAIVLLKKIIGMVRFHHIIRIVYHDEGFFPQIIILMRPFHHATPVEVQPGLGRVLNKDKSVNIMNEVC